MFYVRGIWPGIAMTAIFIQLQRTHSAHFHPDDERFSAISFHVNIQFCCIGKPTVSPQVYARNSLECCRELWPRIEAPTCKCRKKNTSPRFQSIFRINFIFNSTPSGERFQIIRHLFYIFTSKTSFNSMICLI